MSRLAEKVVLVTGASSGIGASIALRCANEGAAVVVCGRNETALNITVERLAATGAAVHGVIADATSDKDMNMAMDMAVAEFGGLHAVFANAGISGMAALDDITYDLFEKVMRTNAYSIVVAARAAARIMREQGSGGSIINTCSVASKAAWPEWTLYSASKYAVRSFTQGLAKELAADKIRVNSICPGMTKTPLWEEPGARLAARGDLEVASDAAAAYSTDVLLGRPAAPEEMTGLAVFLASDDSGYINGQCINIDGGLVFD